jgi:hypothetical protein
MKPTRLYAVSAAILFACAYPQAPAYPSLTLSNRHLTALIYLPDPVSGFYRGPRYDPAGIVARVTTKGHVYFTNFLPIHDPADVSGGAGLCEEFRTPLGYDEAAPGGAVIKPGVGLVRRGSGAYSFGARLEVLEHTPWTVEPQRDRVRFLQRLSTNGWGYEYEKVVSLGPKGAKMRIDHRMKNTGVKTIVTDHYNHHFVLIDDEPVGPSYAASFNFYHVCPSPNTNFIRIDRNVLRVLAPLDTNQAFNMRPAGFSNHKGDQTIVVHNARTRAGLKIEARFPVSAFVTYIDSRTVSPEPFIHLDLKPGESRSWALDYTFFEGAFPVPAEKDLDSLAFHGIDQIRLDGAHFGVFNAVKTNYIVLLDDAGRVPTLEAFGVNPRDRVVVRSPASIPGRATVTFRSDDPRVTPPVFTIDYRWTDIRVTSTSNAASVGPRNTLDGDPDTRWSSEGDGMWICWDLGKVKTLSGVALAWYNGDQRKSFYEMSTSLDGTNWQRFPRAESSGKGSTMETNRFAAPVKARHVKYTGYGNSSSKWNSVLDVEFLER